MPALDEILQQKLRLLDAKHQKRVLRETGQGGGGRVLRGGRELISFCSNDYLGLSQHPEVIAAATEALKKYGAGAGASRLVSGNHPLYAALEEALADHKGNEAACVFGSGYLTNLGVIPALVGKNDLILVDRLAHACMLDAAKISDATFMRFAHNNIEHCRMLLDANRSEYQHCLIVTETVFSMDGDRAPIEALSELAARYDSWLLTDDAHGLGVIPSPKADIQMGTLSKAAGSYGGYVCGSKTLVDYLNTAARSLIYSTGLPPATIAASIASLCVMKKEPDRAKKALENASYFTELLGLKAAESAIVPVIVGENDKALKLAEKLEEKRFLVVAVRPPTVPENTARLRFAFSALHEKKDIERAAEILKKENIPSPLEGEGGRRPGEG
jgi:8-amino-7-oxononanoate synthase